MESVRNCLQIAPSICKQFHAAALFCRIKAHNHSIVLKILDIMKSIWILVYPPLSKRKVPLTLSLERSERAYRFVRRKVARGLTDPFGGKFRQVQECKTKNRFSFLHLAHCLRE